MAMIEETGQVVAIDGEFVWVQTQPRSSCSACHVGADCGTSVLARWFGQRTNRIRVRNGLDLQIGQGAVIGIHETALLKASVVAYFVPLLAMVAAAVVASLAGVGDGAVALWSVTGLGLGLLLLQRLGTGHQRGAYQAALLRKASDFNQSFTIEIPIEIQRGTTS